MMRRSVKRAANEEAKCDAWNAAHKVGTAVLVRRDDGRIVESRTRSQARVLGGHSAVIWLEGITGYYLLDRVCPVPSGGMRDLHE